MLNVKKVNWRNDGIAKVTGRAKYADDLKFYRMLHAVPIYSDFVHAKILNIDCTDAEKMPGVKKIIYRERCAGENPVRANSAGLLHAGYG